MKKLSFITIAKWVFAFLITGIAVYIGYWIQDLFSKGISGAVDTIKTGIKTTVSETFKPTVYHPDKSKPQTWAQKNLPNVTEAKDVFLSWFGIK